MKKHLTFLLSVIFISGCSVQGQTNKFEIAPIEKPPLEKVAQAPAPIQMEVKADAPLLETRGNLYGLGPWLNSEPRGSLEELKGQVVLLKFWTFACSNCIHTLPYVQSWHEKYADQGLTILGIHSPEFAYERKLENVEKSVKQYGLTFPIALDNDFKTWRSFNNRYWPAFYLLDKDGVVRYKHFGQGDYEETEQRIQTLLKELE
ncbi:redoxin domain-containing protein [bacterium]|nr:redoxin domain-containing protein [bacterium]NCQ55475.1 redoxin domain-containing protein [Candidatus Parcubacteria bacterium]NCS67837.1 redoxin domain-containing protein [Candidatus Peregrinibacteria bacterium]NCS96349.1 redoxin domain-containing protein [bacterium]